MFRQRALPPRREGGSTTQSVMPYVRSRIEWGCLARIEWSCSSERFRIAVARGGSSKSGQPLKCVSLLRPLELGSYKQTCQGLTVHERGATRADANEWRQRIFVNRWHVAGEARERFGQCSLQALEMRWCEHGKPYINLSSGSLLRCVSGRRARTADPIRSKAGLTFERRPSRQGAHQGRSAPLQSQ
ncbi:hypothetical protein VUR80DRAFT_6140 [Thermomyces stellatus]